MSSGGARFNAQLEGEDDVKSSAPPGSPKWFKEAVDSPREEGFIMHDDCQIHFLRWRPLHRKERQLSKRELRKKTGRKVKTSLDLEELDRQLQPLVFVHGNGANASWYAFIAPFFREEYDVVAISNSGCGDSSFKDEYNTGIFAEEYVAVCRALGFFKRKLKPIVVSHSLGAVASMYLALHFGHKFAAIIMCDVRIEDLTDEEFRKYQRSNMAERQKSKLFKPRDSFKVWPHSVRPVDKFKLAPPQETTPYVLEYIANESSIQMKDGWKWKGDPERFRKLNLIKKTPFMSLRELKVVIQKVPVALVYGEHSFFLNLRKIKATVLQKATKIVPAFAIPNAEHHLLLDEPLAFISVIRCLLTTWAPYAKPSRGPILGARL